MLRQTESLFFAVDIDFVLLVCRDPLTLPFESEVLENQLLCVWNHFSGTAGSTNSEMGSLERAQRDKDKNQAMGFPLPNMVKTFQDHVDNGTLVPGWQCPSTWLLG